MYKTYGTVQHSKLNQLNNENYFKKACFYSKIHCENDFRVRVGFEGNFYSNDKMKRLLVTWLNTIWLNFFVESFGLKILSQVTTKLSQLHSNSRNKYVNSRKYHNVGHMRCMHAHPHRRKDQLPLRSLRDLRSR